ncbi:MAG: S1 family peptidase [Elusimicrobia bacterium]|nr:S1 family peptidase [Elusimicrobiota bacterium]
MRPASIAALAAVVISSYSGSASALGSTAYTEADRGRVINAVAGPGTETPDAATPIAQVTVPVIAHTEGEIPLCTGVLIAEDLVLTAAHCVPDPATKDKVEILYDLDPKRTTPDLYKDAGTSRIFSTQYVRHETYRRSTGIFDIPYGIDLALVRLTPSLTGRAVASLPSAGLELSDDGVDVTVAGWGSRGPDAGYGLRSGTVRMRPSFSLLSQEEGKAEYEPGAVTICPGDSGGPAFSLQSGGPPVVVAVHSYRIGYCPNARGKATYVPSWIGWIEAKSAELRGRKD